MTLPNETALAVLVLIVFKSEADAVVSVTVISNSFVFTPLLVVRVTRSATVPVEMFAMYLLAAIASNNIAWARVMFPVIVTVSLVAYPAKSFALSVLSI